jgi:hypothetical protein
MPCRRAPESPPPRAGVGGVPLRGPMAGPRGGASFRPVLDSVALATELSYASIANLGSRSNSRPLSYFSNLLLNRFTITPLKIVANALLETSDNINNNNNNNNDNNNNNCHYNFSSTTITATIHPPFANASDFNNFIYYNNLSIYSILGLLLYKIFPRFNIYVAILTILGFLLGITIVICSEEISEYLDFSVKRSFKMDFFRMRRAKRRKASRVRKRRFKKSHRTSLSTLHSISLFVPIISFFVKMPFEIDSPASAHRAPIREDDSQGQDDAAG